MPVTRRLEVMHEEQLIAQRAQWVLKSDYGAEGEEVVIGRDVDDADLARVLDAREPGTMGRAAVLRGGDGRRRAHRELRRLPRRGQSASGLYARVQVGATDGAGEERAGAGAGLIRGRVTPPSPSSVA